MTVDSNHADDTNDRAELSAFDALKASGALDEVMAKIDTGQLQITGQGGFLQEMVKAVLERGLQTELTEHLGYDKGDLAGRLLPNARNGFSSKTVSSEVGDVPLAIPRDRDGTFVPTLVPRGARRIGGLDDMIVALYAGGMTVRDIEHHLASTIGTEISRETISKITDSVLEEVLEWQRRPLDPIYPILYLDAIVVKIRSGQQVTNRAAHIAVGVDLDGIKHVLGIWVQEHEGAKFWAGICAELANRGVRDVLIACTDGLTGFGDAIEATWPHTVVQTCTVHLIRASMRFVAYGDRKAVASSLRSIYTAPTVDAAQAALDDFKSSQWGVKYPTAVRTWESAWERFIPFLAFPPALRKIIYTTNAIESLNYQLRKIIKNRGHFPNDQAAVKLLWLAICSIEDKRARERDRLSKDRLAPRTGREVNRLIEGSLTTGWKQALGALVINYPDRLDPYLT
ncbi:IS256 family transposase [Rhodococcus sp. IEGM 1401]|uniref:IS256 family transposase n=1 Tax=unclassified Rhodococcus (in: high G+C Gram-positive bacteria) TaxID=192944 RepID=UPI0005B471A4|nr:MULTISPECIES: IS256 family transposase [unclassified Rhodococcus (in: high G+C Gram-positive bacteria)]MCJ0895384.1 IS256 family transposase [Rhodococcus sp. ARC_M5]MCZ4564205.1 IS256 family transposase [Rhodococcus sp. IEGM 1401]MDI9924337.1 IS256 family transposase [Rhodococcus sp. IEGM 1372]MDV8036784.1 IS256 family transposase [Rhodococcus sp. IEGM 1414]